MTIWDSEATISESHNDLARARIEMNDLREKIRKFETNSDGIDQHVIRLKVQLEEEKKLARAQLEEERKTFAKHKADALKEHQELQRKQQEEFQKAQKQIAEQQSEIQVMKQQMQAEFEKLPAERQAAVKGWYAVQAYTAEQLGLPVDEWMAYVQWAFANPLDFSFVADFPELASAIAAGDGFETTGQSEAAAALIGSKAPTTLSNEKPTSGSSLLNMMLGRPEAKDESSGS